MIVASTRARGVSGFWDWWTDLVVPDGASDVSYSDIRELTVLPPEQLDPETRARLEAVVAGGQARQQQRERNRAALLSLGFIGVAGIGLAMAVNALRRSR